MKKNYVFFFVFVCLLWVQPSQAQLVANFEDVLLQNESYWNGSDGSGQFSSGPITFLNNYNVNYMSWSGFACSNITDNTTPGFVNQYSSIVGNGAKNSSNYAVGYNFGADTMQFTKTTNLLGLYVTNATYAALAMKNGDEYSKKVGGTSGDDEDWFKLTISGYKKDNSLVRSVDFYLADYRFENNSLDYIVDDWQWVDLSSIQAVDYVTFNLSSSDNSDWGMNTPGYFCLDNVTLNDFTNITFEVSDGDSKIDGVTIDFDGTTIITDINGLAVFEQVSPSAQMRVLATKPGYVEYAEVINGFETTWVEILIAVGLKKTEPLDEVLVFPNPVYDEMEITSKVIISDIEIYNVSGQLILSSNQLFQYKTSFDLSVLKQGVYFVNIKSESTNILKKFIKH